MIDEFVFVTMTQVSDEARQNEEIQRRREESSYGLCAAAAVKLLNFDMNQNLLMSLTEP